MAKVYQKRDMTKGDKQADLGLKPERPFQILGLTTQTEIDDLLLDVVFLSTLANQFDHARLHVKFRDVRPYSRAIMSLSPWIDLAEALPGEWPKPIRKCFPRLQPWRQPDVGWLNGGRAYYYDMVVTHPMMRGMALRELPDPVALRLPEDRRAEMKSRLVARGLKPDRWFAVLRCGESACRHLADRIIALGGQAVSLGEPGMGQSGPRADLVDLSGEKDDFLLQAAAVSHARFMITASSRLMALAPAFAVPSTLIDAVDLDGIWGLGHGDVLTHEVTTPKGAVFRNASLFAAGLLDKARLRALTAAEPGCLIRKANGEELARVATKLYDRTNDCPAWRPPAEAPSGPRPNQIMWPLSPAHSLDWVTL